MGECGWCFQIYPQPIWAGKAIRFRTFRCPIKNKIMEYQELVNVLKEQGISESRLDKAMDSANVPEKGTITGWEVKNPKTKSAYVALKFPDGSSCSYSRFRGQAHFGKGAMVFNPGKKPETKRGLFLRTTVLNPHIPADQARGILALMGKEFTSERVMGKVQNGFTDDGELTLATTKESAEAQIVTKDFWAVKFD